MGPWEPLLYRIAPAAPTSADPPSPWVILSYQASKRPLSLTVIAKPTAGGVASSSADPAEAQWGKQLRELAEMGFVDRSAAVRALESANGDVGTAVMMLAS